MDDDSMLYCSVRPQLRRHSHSSALPSYSVRVEWSNTPIQAVSLNTPESYGWSGVLYDGDDGMQACSLVGPLRFRCSRSILSKANGK